MRTARVKNTWTRRLRLVSLSLTVGWSKRERAMKFAFFTRTYGPHFGPVCERDGVGRAPWVRMQTVKQRVSHCRAKKGQVSLLRTSSTVASRRQPVAQRLENSNDGQCT